MNLHHRQSAPSGRGATVLELVLYVGLVGIILTAATLFAWEFAASQAKASAYAEVVHNARFAMSRLEAEVREADSINTGSSAFGAHPGILSLATASGPTNPTIFAVASGALTVQQGAGAATALTNGKVEVEEFIVDDVSVTSKTRAVRLRLKLRSLNPSNFLQESATTTVETTVRVRAKDGFSN